MTVSIAPPTLPAYSEEDHRVWAALCARQLPLMERRACRLFRAGFPRLGLDLQRLPDPAVIGNAGSFFKNPVVPAQQALALADAHPGLPVFPGGDADSRKLSAAWLIDACGWKGHRDGDAGVSAQHALVLVNHGAATGAQLLALARAIAGSVDARFGVALEPEPRIVGASW